MERVRQALGLAYIEPSTGKYGKSLLIDSIQFIGNS
ncbi:hypothetical protein NT6N_07040 [Oceaniferula spumae]|uniref:Uncharacterized protein n=1 Tax=Oceaniferula spumae TaxID=2979115 RepID=A0AAT9FI51_9BACT